MVQNYRVYVNLVNIRAKKSYRLNPSAIATYPYCFFFFNFHKIAPRAFSWTKKKSGLQIPVVIYN